jgi:hypothetical protein
MRINLRRRLLDFLILMLCIFYSTAFAFAQSETAELSGQVTDPQGAAVPGVEVVVTNVATNVSARTKTNSVGFYTVTGLKPGHYNVSYAKEGFKKSGVVDLVLNVQESVSRNLQLELGSPTESITVTAAGETVNTASVSTTVDRTFVENMPLNGRSFQSLIELTPGIVNAKTSYNGTGGQFSADGQRTDSNYYTIDGTSANVGVQTMSASLGSTGGGALPATSAAGGFNNLVSVDAMEEFKIQTSTYAPEFGRTPGAQISIPSEGSSRPKKQVVLIRARVVLTGLLGKRRRTNSPRKSVLAAISLAYKLPKTFWGWSERAGPIRHKNSLTSPGLKSRAGQNS